VNPLLELLNAVLGETLAQPAPEGAAQGAPGGSGGGQAAAALQVRSVVLDDTGARIVLSLQGPAGAGELVLRLQAEPPQGERQTLGLAVEQPPERWPAALEPFRRVLERARLRLELDFPP
jgi:hypothetical protein